MISEQLHKDAIRLKVWHEGHVAQAKDCAMFNVTQALQEIAEGHQQAANTIAALIGAISQPAQYDEIARLKRVIDELEKRELGAVAAIASGAKAHAKLPQGFAISRDGDDWRVTLVFKDGDDAKAVAGYMDLQGVPAVNVLASQEQAK